MVDLKSACKSRIKLEATECTLRIAGPSDDAASSKAVFCYEYEYIMQISILDTLCWYESIMQILQVEAGAKASGAPEKQKTSRAVQKAVWGERTPRVRRASIRYQIKWEWCIG